MLLFSSFLFQHLLGIASRVVDAQSKALCFGRIAIEIVLHSTRFSVGDIQQAATKNGEK